VVFIKRSTILAPILAASVTAVAQQEPPAQLPPAEAREQNLRAYTELLRSDIRMQKVAVITQMMRFTEQEDAVFWPIYREYELELSRINDDRLRLIETYARVYDTLTEETANALVEKSLDLESRRTALKQKYYNKLKTALPPRTAAKLMQIENQILLLLDLQVAAALPVVR
jgi:hypothetical protein